MNVEADSMTHDETKQISVLSGSVLLTKGTIRIMAERVDLRKDAQEHQFLQATAKPQERVFFRVKREGLDEYMEGEALQVDYDSKEDVARLTGRAVMRRLRGGVLADELMGHVIVFNNTTETLTVNGAVASKGVTNLATGVAPGRVRMMLSPKQP